jgi:type IV secretory pathway VirB4 component
MIEFRKKPKEKKITDYKQDIKESIFKERSLRERLAPEGVNPNPLGYMTISDKGKEIYIRNMYIDKAPKKTTFASTFATVFNYENATASVFIEPMLEGTASKQLDKRVLELETEENEANKGGNRNRFRKMSTKRSKAEQWASNVESGETLMYEVAFLFTLYADSLESLGLRTSEFVSMAREKGLDMVASYAAHPEAFLSNGPFNKKFNTTDGLIHVPNIRTLIMDEKSLSTIYAHTSTSINHPNGVPLGRNRHNGEPFCYDPYDKSHQGFGAVFCGKTGTGKSATIKILESRLIPFGYRAAIIDSDKKGNRGEYSLFTERSGGVNYQIKSNSQHIINIFELDVQDEYDEVTDSEYKKLRVLDKVNDVTNIILTMLIGTKNKPGFETNTYIESIVTKAVTELYSDRGIFDNDVESLYTTGHVIKDGKILNGKIKKDLPTISDFFLKILYLQKTDEEVFHKEAYTLILDIIVNYVRDLYYDSNLNKLTKDEYEEALKSPKTDIHVDYYHIKGTKGFYDGQSTVFVTRSTPVINIDISDLPKGDIPVAQEVALNFINENVIKKNSENPKKAGKVVLILDEAHRLFPYENARILIADVYRTARKRNVSPWTCTQAYIDFKGYPETETMVSQSTSIFLFKQDIQDRDYLKEKTILTESQIDEVISQGGDPDDMEDVEHKGEVCLIDSDRVIFLKVDYLFATESVVVETDMSKIQAIYR